MADVNTLKWHEMVEWWEGGKNNQLPIPTEAVLGFKFTRNDWYAIIRLFEYRASPNGEYHSASWNKGCLKLARLIGHINKNPNDKGACLKLKKHLEDAMEHEERRLSRKSYVIQREPQTGDGYALVTVMPNRPGLKIRSLMIGDRPEAIKRASDFTKKLATDNEYPVVKLLRCEPIENIPVAPPWRRGYGNYMSWEY